MNRYLLCIVGCIILILICTACKFEKTLPLKQEYSYSVIRYQDFNFCSVMEIQDKKTAKRFFIVNKHDHRGGISIIEVKY